MGFEKTYYYGPHLNVGGFLFIIIFMVYENYYNGRTVGNDYGG
jgi:hypothetical protein